MNDNTVSATSIGADYSVRPGPQLIELIREHARAKVPIFLWGAPGIGKSGCAQQAAAVLRWVNGEVQWPWTYVDVRALTMEPIDLRGIPYRPQGQLILVTRPDGRQLAVAVSSIATVVPRDDEGCDLERMDGNVVTVKESLPQIMKLVDPDQTYYAAPAVLPPSGAEGSYLVNLEELPSAVPSMQAALYQLVLDRKLGDYVLPEGASIMACGNREDDMGHVHKLLSPLASRFTHVNVENPEAKTWYKWAVHSGIRPEVLYFLQYKPELLFTFDPDRYKRGKEYAYACPRTWEMVSKIEDGCQLSDSSFRSSIVGTVGEGPATDYFAFRRVWKGMPNAYDILANPDHAPLPEYDNKYGQQFALCGSVAHIVDDASMPNMVAYAKRLRMEMGEFMIYTALRKNPTLRYSTSFIEWEAWRSHR